MTRVGWDGRRSDGCVRRACPCAALRGPPPASTWIETDVVSDSWFRSMHPWPSLGRTDAARALHRPSSIEHWARIGLGGGLSDCVRAFLPSRRFAPSRSSARRRRSDLDLAGSDLRSLDSFSGGLAVRVQVQHLHLAMAPQDRSHCNSIEGRLAIRKAVGLWGGCACLRAQNKRRDRDQLLDNFVGHVGVVPIEARLGASPNQLRCGRARNYVDRDRLQAVGADGYY